MAPFPNWLRNSLLAGCMAALPVLSALVVVVPTGTKIEIRLKTKIASNTSKPDDPVETMVIAPVMVNGATAIPAGVTLHGVVTGASAATDPTGRATLALDFRELEMGGQRIQVHTQLTAVENARENVDDKGEIQGILADETLSSRMDSGIDKVTEKYSGFGGLLSAAKKAVFKETDGDISYDSGVEMDLKLTAALTLTGPPPPGPDASLQPAADPRALIDLVNRQPFQTRAQKPPQPSDITTLMFIGSQEQFQGAFADAGWSQASKLGEKSKFETLRAIAEDRGYSEAPVSILYLDGRPPDMVFEKANNTFSKRHHLRIWLRPDQYQGQPVWVCAATHDTGIDFSAKDRTFIHKIDSQIDLERSKVVNDLLLTGKVQSLLMVDRPNVPRNGRNATGDNLTTDGKMAVVILD
ncbi:MAG TPA: LssY C-terminal domain-containing protein [Bryobacteraceae bacterium]|nr:LssY C-terminal domain-containing protein [Bryobacteraceae bacterium]